MTRRALIVGNWKMHGLASARAVIEEIALRAPAGPELLICPPATLISRLAGLGVAIGGQDCHRAESGAHTGDVSAEMLADAGAVAVILGHSERRAAHGETDEMVREKAAGAWRGGLVSIICIGETADERGAGDALTVILRQLAGSIPAAAAAASTVVAYEPVWAIGSGRTPGMGEIEETHAAIRHELARRFGDEGAAMRILYGGSMNPGNAEEILGVPNVDGGLIGGASLAAADFLRIADQAALRKSP